MHGHTYVCSWVWMFRFPLYSTGLCPLQFPPGPLPCLHNSHHHKIPEQGKGTDDYLLPLGDWFSSIPLLFIRQKAPT